MTLTADEVRSATFEKPKWPKRGYDEKAVGDFLQLVARRIEGRGHLSADDVRSIRFQKCALGKRGYAPEEVDRLLQEVAATIEQLGDRPG